MADQPVFRDVVRFGPFEWDPARAELRRRGVRLRLTGQPLDVLTLLIAHADRVVTREELRRELWGEETVFVDFEQGLNTAIARLRQTLGDSAENPRFIETIPGRGYRFIAELGPAPRLEAEATPPRASGINRRTWLAGSLGLVVGGASAYLGVRPEAPPERAQVPGRFIVSAPPAPPLLSSTSFQDLAISPDGHHIVYRAGIEGAAGLYVRALDRIEGRFLPGTDLWSPFFSPDSTHVGFYAFAVRSLMRTSVLGGPPLRVADSLEYLAGASWSADDQIVFATTNSSQGIMRVAASGGRPEALTRPGPGENHVMPEWLPGDRGLLFTVLPTDGGDAPPRIAALDIRSGEVRTLMAGSHPRYAASGHLVYVLENDLLAVRFNVQRLGVEGEPATVLPGIEATRGFGQYSFSRNGTLLVVMDSRSTRRELVWVDRDGREKSFPAQPRAYTYPRISPQGRRIALNARETNRGQILVWDAARAAATPILSGPGESDLYPVWTSDGRRLAYISGVGSRHQLRVVAVGSAGPGEPVASGFELRAPYFFSPSGSELVYARQGPDGVTNDVALWKTSLGQDAEPVRLLGGARNADLSPDGRFIVYQANQTGRFEVYVRSFPNIEDQYVKVSTAGGIQPVWSPRNDELFYVEPGSPSHLMSVSVDAGSDLVVSGPRPLLEWPYFQAELGRTYDVLRPDGRWFLAVKSAREESGGAPQEARVEIVLDWFQELQRLVPTR